MRIVRWPAARCSRTRRIPAGKLFVRISCVSSSSASAWICSTGRVLVAAIEVAQEVAAIDAVEAQQAGRLGERSHRVADALTAIEPACRQPRVALDDVAGDQRVLEVEGGDRAVRRQDLAAQPVLAVGASSSSASS